MARSRGSRSKFGNTKIVADGIQWDSLWEHKIWEMLKIRQSAGEISQLRDHVSWRLQDPFKDRFGHRHEKIDYEADFDYWEGETHVVADAKGRRTDVFNLKYKLFCHRYPEIKFVIYPYPKERRRRS